MTLTWRKKKTVDEFVASQKGLHVTTCNLSKQLLEPLEYNNHYTRERKQKKKKNDWNSYTTQFNLVSGMDNEG